MNITNGPIKRSPGVDIELTGDEVALAIDAWLVGQGVHVSGPRTVTVNGELCERGRVNVDPSGFVIAADGRKVEPWVPMKRWCGTCARAACNSGVPCPPSLLNECQPKDGEWKYVNWRPVE